MLSLCVLALVLALPILGTAGTRLEGSPMHARVAYFRLKSGSFEQVVSAVKAPGGLLGIFREQPGFQSYELIETGSGLISVSHWESSTQADAASRVAAAWATDHIDDLVKLQQSDVGEVVLSSLAPAAASAH